MIISEIVPNDILKELKKRKWYRHGIYRDDVITSTLWPSGLGSEYFKNEWINQGIPDIIKINEQAYLTEDIFSELSNIMYEKIKKEPNYLKNYIKKYRTENEKTIKATKAITKKFSKKLSSKELSNLFTKFVGGSMELMHWLWSMEFLNDAIDKYTKEKVKAWKPQWSEQQILDFLSLISYVDKLLPFQKERNEALSGESIDKMYKKYCWINMNTWNGRPFTKEEYKKRILNIISNKERVKEEIRISRGNAEKAKKAISSVDDKDLKELLKRIQELIFLKTERIDVFTITWYYMLDIVDEICNRTGYSYDELQKLTTTEVPEILSRKKINKEEFKKREKFAAVRLNNKVHLFAGEAYDIIMAAINPNDYSKLTELKGNSAYKGTVRGTARVLMTDAELYKLKKGDILICNLTNPNYNPAFDKIAGVVTDEGGLLCHSAIMAREFKLPCVIGTKIATKVFKDDDLVEVDANKGVVKILKKHD